METLVQTVGWAGSFLLIVAYILISLKKFDGKSRLYQIMNLLGAVGVGVNVFHQQAWPAFTVNVFWGLVAVVTLMNFEPKG